MFKAETIPRNMSRNGGGGFLFSNDSDNYKHVPAEGGFMKSKDLTGSELFQNQNNQEQQGGGGLARYRSAPGSFLASLLGSASDNSGGGGDDSEALFSAFMDGGPLDLNQKNDGQIQYPMKQEVGADAAELRQGKNGFSAAGQMGFSAAMSVGGATVVGSYSVGMESQAHDKVNTGGSCLNLSRQNSSPAGFFSGFGAMSEVGNYKVFNHSEVNPSSTGMRNHISFNSPASSSTSRFMPTILENGSVSMGAPNSENQALRINGSANDREYDQFPFSQDPWSDSLFKGSKRTRDGDVKMFSNINGLENQNQETGTKPSGLVHHLSLPKTPSEMTEAQKFLHFQQDTVVPCQIRAKRGFATHPRSIAERMRRTRISEKMKKLQDLFPNMDKQTNTADMLDLAVEHIKDLQKQVKLLTDTKAKCICSSKSTPTITREGTR